MSKKFTAKATNVLNRALRLASELGHTYIGSEHLLLALVSEADSVASKLLDGRGITAEGVRSALTARIGVGEKTFLTSGDMTPRTKRIIEASSAEAERYLQTYVGTEHILLALVKEPGSTALTVLTDLGATEKDIVEDATAFFGEISGTSATNGSRVRSIDDCPTLKKYGKDLTALARLGKLDPVIGREREIERVIQILSRRTKNNPCLIGEPGVGKTAVVEGLAARIVEQRVPETLIGRLIVTLDLSAMVAGAKYRGEFEERMKAVTAELARNPSVILFIDEMHTLVGAGAAEGAVDAANLLKPALSRGEISLIGATTTAEYRKHIEKDAALERRFGPVTVEEPTEDEAVAILSGLRDKYESHHKVKITDEAIRTAVTLSVRYIGDRYLPDKALDLLDEAAVSARIRCFTAPSELNSVKEKLSGVRADKEEAIRSQDFEKAAALRDREHGLSAEYEKLCAEWREAREAVVPSVGEDDIAAVVSLFTGVPTKKLEADERERLIGLADALKRRVIGQDAAADVLARAIRRGRLGIGEQSRPVGSFLFLGPTGVGKTELCRALAEALFGDRNAMIRIDMSELSEPHSTSKLIGSPPGYVGYGEGGQLTEKIRRKPYSVVLFDEIEKAHSDVWSIMLQVLEDGHLTDSEGRTVSFKNAVIIMTSNVGAEKLTDRRVPLGFSQSEDTSEKSEVMQSLRAAFRPEFLNRIDETVIFNTLTPDDIAGICGLMLEDVKQRLRSLGFEVEFSKDVIEFLAEEGYDIRYGARPLRRAIRTYVEDALADALLTDGGFEAGTSIIARLDGNKVKFTAK